MAILRKTSLPSTAGVLDCFWITRWILLVVSFPTFIAGMVSSPVLLGSKVMFHVCVREAVPLIRLKFWLWLLPMIWKSSFKWLRSGSPELFSDFISRTTVSSMLRTVLPVDAVTSARAKLDCKNKVRQNRILDRPHFDFCWTISWTINLITTTVLPHTESL